MRLNLTCTKLILEIIRIKDEQQGDLCSIPMLIHALFDIRDPQSPDFINLFYTYISKVLEVKSVNVQKALEKFSPASTEKQPYSTFSFTGIGSDGENFTITLEADEELSSVFEALKKFMVENHRTDVLCDYLTIALFESNSKTFRTFLKELALNYMDMQYFFQKEKIFGYELVPYEVSSFIKHANPLYKGKDIDIVGRDEELKEVYRIMLKSSKRNVIIYGFPGVGKSAVGEKFIYEIANGKCPARFKHFTVLEMSVKDFLLSCDDSKTANEKMNFLLEFLTRRENDIILLIDEIQTILGQGNFFEQKKIDLSATLKPILARGDIRIVGITTTKDYSSSFMSDSTLSRRFEGVEIREIKYKEVHNVIYPRVKAKEAEKGIKISDELIDDAIWYAACFEYHKCNPDKSIDVIDRAMANAQLDDRTYVLKQDIIDVFKISYKKWNGMEDLVKKGVAFHEAGHYVISRVTKTRDMDVLAVSIYPTDDYEGVNVFEYNEEITPVMNWQYYIDSIAVDLAGRVAEELAIKEITSSASADLITATEKAQDMIMSFGLTEDGVSKNRVFLSEGLLGLGSEETTKDVEDEVERVLLLSYKHAQDLLNEYRDYLDAIAEGLLKKQILRKEELDEIWQKVANRHIVRSSSIKKKTPKSRKKTINSKNNFLKKFQSEVRNIKRSIGKFLLK